MSSHQAPVVAKEQEEIVLESTIKNVAIVGTGIMGSGLTYLFSSKKIPVILKATNTKSIARGLSETQKQLLRLVERKRMSEEQMNDALGQIYPTLDFDALHVADFVIETIIESVEAKVVVLKKIEQVVDKKTVIVSNTSTISITLLAQDLKRPENFVGMHFFNPAHVMPLIEIVRGSKSSDKAIDVAIALAKRLGKTPIMVSDTPGFFINRALHAYFCGFEQLLKDGADFQIIDKIMEKFGWPKGPAALIDAVGIDTCVHGGKVLAEGFPDRMIPLFLGANKILFNEGRLGQKNYSGYYAYAMSKHGNLIKALDDSTYDLLKPEVNATQEFEEQDIINRMLLPLINEVIRCLEDGVISHPSEADAALILGLGFPMARGGVCHYIDNMGVVSYLQLCQKYQYLGPLYQAPPMLHTMCEKQLTFYPVA